MSRFVICRASAGSGKTYTLVRQFIEIAISEASDEQIRIRFRQILAITFTNKAANGMKARIMSRLHDIVVNNPDVQKLVSEMADHLEISNEEVVRRCSVLQSAILHNYSDLSICTIDSFVHRIVRTFAHDLNLPMNFNVQIDNQEILQNVIDELLSLAGNPNETALTRLLCAYTESRMESGKGYKIENTILELSKEVLKEESPRYLSQLEKIDLDQYIQIHRRLTSRVRAYESTLSSVAQAFIDACASHGLDADSFPYKGSSVYAFILALANGNYDKINKPHKRIDEAYNSGCLHSKTTPKDKLPAFQAVVPPFRKVYETINDQLVRYNTDRLLLANLYGLALLDKVNRIKNNYCNANEIVHISEFNKRIDQQVASEPAPFIYERIGNRYHNYLIDEFQDTSRLQWLNFLPLFDEAMTYSFHDAVPENGRQSLVVGDGKQAIYRFRQGNVKQFIQLPKVDSTLHGLSLQREARIDRLKHNFRTLANIVHFNNRFFTSLINTHFNHNEQLRQLYIGQADDGHPELEQQPVKEGGFVSLSFSPKEELIPHIADIIRHQVDDLHYSYGDIMVLARDNDTLVRISDHLTSALQHPVPIVSSESFVLSKSNAVLLLHNLLRYLHNPSDRVAALQSLQLAVKCGSLNTQVDSDTLVWQLRKENFVLEQVLDTYGIQFNPDYLRTLSLYDCCEHLVRLLKIDQNDSAYVASFLNEVASYMQHPHPSLHRLVEYLDDKIDRLSCSTATDIDAVQLMTIHKAKGLESKIVILALPYKRSPIKQLWVTSHDDDTTTPPVALVNMQSVTTSFDADFDNERALIEIDRVNLLYVAMTRPEEKLFVCCDDTTSADSFAPMLRSFVKSDNESTEIDDVNYVVGNDFDNPRWAAPKKATAECCRTIDIDSVSFPQWENRISIAAQNDALLSIIDADNRRYGIVIHNLLAQIITPDDIPQVVSSYAHSNHIPPQDADAILQRIQRMVSNPENRRYFDPEYTVRCEAPIAINGTTRRPDRIVFAHDQTWVVDFKTGTRNDESHKKYQRQVAEYADALTAMGYPNVQPVIIYL
ncbi:MAG: UvrD-helicase domain-containing protein [Bacteroidales bacterium]|nr:UvrD-helicase domain-containing protein [Bacteroidales bacterium]